MTAAGHLNILMADAFLSDCVQEQSNSHDLRFSVSPSPPKEKREIRRESGFSHHLTMYQPLSYLHY